MFFIAQIIAAALDRGGLNAVIGLHGSLLVSR
jgi:hypothetical protein